MLNSLILPITMHLLEFLVREAVVVIILLQGNFAEFFHNEVTIERVKFSCCVLLDFG